MRNKLVMRHVELAYFDSYTVLEEVCALRSATYSKNVFLITFCAFLVLNKFIPESEFV